MFFFDDWMLHAREGLDRKQGQPKWVKEIEMGSHPDLKWIRGVRTGHDERRGCYFMVIDCNTKAGKRFWTRVETKDPYNWPKQDWTPGNGPLETRAENAYRDQNGETLDCFDLFCLAGTPLADKGYVMALFDHGNTHRGGPNHSKKPSAAIAFSQDGLHFEVEDAFYIQHHSDADNTPFYNPWTKEYLITCRPEQTDRRISVVTTTDFKTFSSDIVVLQPDALDPVGREFYALQPILYDDIFVGMLLVFDAEPTEKVYWKDEGTHETQVAYSYNGRHWYRSFRETFIARGEAGAPNGGMVWAFPPVRTPDNRLLFTSSGFPADHNADVDKLKRLWTTDLYEMRLDGFAYLRTRARQGLIRTKGVVPQGGDMTVNARMTPSGHVKVAVLDTAFKPLPGYTIEDAIPITGDELFAKVRWRERENMDELKGKTVIIEVQVREGELYLGEYPHDRL